MNNTNTRTVEGTWQNANKNTQIIIYRGRKNTKYKRYDEDTSKYYGRVLSSKNSLTPNQKILINFKAVGLDYLRDGQALHYPNNKMYEAYIRLMPNGTLKIRKYIQKTIIGHTDIWTRVMKKEGKSK